MTGVTRWDSGSAAIWEPYLTDQDRQVIRTAGYGGRVGWGARTAVVVVDMTYGFCGDHPADAFAAAAERPTACDASAWLAISATAELLSAVRSAGVPVIYTRPGTRAHGWGGGRWEDKNSRMAEVDERARQIVAEVGPAAADAVLDKEGPSAFFGTPLVSWLLGLNIDTLVVCGGTTSGCIRATVVDAFSHNFRVIVPHEATFDRIDASHRIALFELDLKYADVAPLAEVVARLGQVGRGRSPVMSGPAGGDRGLSVGAAEPADQPGRR